MDTRDPLQLRKRDFLAVLLVVVLAVGTALCFLPAGGNQARYAEIYLNSQKIKTVPLDEPQTFTVTGQYTNEITVADGKIAITHSDCPGNDCVHSGFSDSTGRSIVCLPNQLEIRILAGNDDVDFVVG